VKLKLKYHLLISLIICFFGYDAFAQKTISIVYVLDSCDVQSVIDSTAVFSDFEAAQKHLYQQHQTLINEGYFEASIDSIINNQTKLIAHLNIGSKYNDITINITKFPVELKKHLNLNETQNYIELSLNEWQNFNNQILKYAENNGHPFAAISLSNTKIENNNISANINFKLNKSMRFDSLLVKGNAKLNAAFLQNLLHIKQGDEFKASQLNTIYKTFEALPYLDQYRPPAVEFLSSGANVMLYVNDKKANQFDFVIGLLPQSQGVKLTGEGQFTLQNAFGFGERLHLNYTNLPNSGRQLKAEVKANYLPYLPVGANIDFNLYIQDTSFINRNFKVGILYPFKVNNFFEVYFANEQSGLLEIDENQIIQTKELPENLDWQTNKYGFNLYLENYNYRFNPTKGYSVDFNISLGQRGVIINNRITNLVDKKNSAYDFELLYDDIVINTSKIEIKAKVEKYFPIKSNSTIKTMLNFAYFYTSESLASVYENELYRIGGLHTLRGFDEASILSNLFNVVTVEYRYLIARRSFFSCFANAAFIQNQQLELLEEKYSTLFYGTGLGLNFETSGGIFSLNYALGNQQYNNVSLKSGKIHFGYINVF